MEAVSSDFARSLVGTHLAFRSKGSEDAFRGVHFPTEISFLDRESHTALAAGGTPCVMLLAELTDHYRTKPYYMAVRGGIVMRRYRPAVIDYMGLSSDERLKRIMALETTELDREVFLKIVKYFLRNFPSKRTAFKESLTHSEYIQVTAGL
jgi:hypothetical protein